MSWPSRWMMRRAAKKYARRLPAELRAGWGAAQFYTPDQVAAVIKRLRLEGPHEALAYATFTTEADFAGLGQTKIGYDEARSVMARAAPGVLSATYRHDPMSNSDAANRYGIGA